MDFEKEEELPDYIKENHNVFDRFTFDNLFKTLLAEGFDNETAKDVILFNCALSTLVIQERIYNKYYLKIKATDGIASDLQELFNEESKNIPHRWN